MAKAESGEAFSSPLHAGRKHTHLRESLPAPPFSENLSLSLYLSLSSLPLPKGWWRRAARKRDAGEMFADVRTEEDRVVYHKAAAELSQSFLIH